MSKKILKVFLLLSFFIIFMACGGGNGAGSGGTPHNEGDGGTDDDIPDVGSAGEPYDIGDVTVTDIFISPTGDDSNSGNSLEEPLETLTAAWNAIPDGELSDTGYRINMLPGSYPCGDEEMTSCFNYFEAKHGTSEFPIIIRSVDDEGEEASGEAVVRGGMDLHDISYLYLIGLSMPAGDSYPLNNSGNNVLHISDSDHILMRGLTLAGSDDREEPTYLIQEVLKVNQGEAIYLESSDLSGTYQTVLDYFSVQGGHILNSKIYNSGGRCAYLKGGSAYFRVEGNEFYECVEAGFQAGEGSNFDLMRSPWIHYEAYDVKVVNNIIHDIWGAGLSVSGGYNILMAYNTLYRIGMTDAGSRDWTLAQFVHGARGCAYGIDEYPEAVDASAKCQDLIDEGGFGSATAIAAGSETSQIIPNKNIFVYNNIFYNPSGVHTAASHFAVDGPVTLTADVENISDPSVTDDNLVIQGNIVWNGDGLELLSSTNGSDPGCEDDNPTCNSDQLTEDNEINTIEPELTDPAGGDFTPVAGGNITDVEAVEIPDFTWEDFVPDVTDGNLGNEVTSNYAGDDRDGAGNPGAF